MASPALFSTTPCHPLPMVLGLCMIVPSGFAWVVKTSELRERERERETKLRENDMGLF